MTVLFDGELDVLEGYISVEAAQARFGDVAEGICRAVERFPWSRFEWPLGVHHRPADRAGSVTG
ncbi:hypothetical protein L1857_26275 [Amycolatopsis thermalba]|uniref:Uncharacterized protein n=1 Tax=Amycolatopsis thermalba TaxID=944492 RepID=A0ABY4P159_9PSEU|nr:MULTISPECIES: hypothetical protein [Amycolatopsis]UQS26070.1 hypothetical protein L1857_26275 [Amycolatopsis thermalba]